MSRTAPAAEGKKTARLGLRAALVALLLVALTGVLAPIQWLAGRMGSAWQRRLPLLWHRVAVRLVGIRVDRLGEPARGRPLLLVANHQSWADILVLGSLVEASFIAKSEVAGWPAFGTLARLQRTVFVEREARRGVRRESDGIARRLAAGDAMILFAEGTTSDGNAVLPFRSALFGAAQFALTRSGEEEMLVQPVAVAFTRLHGLPLGRSGRPLAAWPGDVPFLPHLLRFLREGAFDAVVSFGEPIAVGPGTDRKRLAARCQAEVSGLLGEALHGQVVQPRHRREPINACVEAAAGRY